MALKGRKKELPFAAQTAADSAARTAMDNGMKQVEVMVSGPGAGRETANQSLTRSRIRNYFNSRYYSYPSQWLSSTKKTSSLSRNYQIK